MNLMEDKMGVGQQIPVNNNQWNQFDMK